MIKPETITHTLVIYILGFVFLVLDRSHTITDVLPYIETFSGLLVLVIGLNLVYNGYKNYRRSILQQQIHSLPYRTEPPQEKPVPIQNKKDLLLAGVSGGVIPCLDAFALLMLSVSLQKIALGIFMVFVFSVGLATTIILLGLLLLKGKTQFKFDERLGTVAAVYAPIVSGLIIFLIALGLLI